MFKLQRQSRQVACRSGEGGERFDFKFSNFQAIQVPKGWDKLLVSVISVETGKIIAKSSKAPVRNGNCQWSETLSESIQVSQNDSTKALDDCLLKFVVAMGSARSGILGEATVNMADYMSSKSSVPVFLPLKKCSQGTILQVKIQCLNPNIKLRVQELKNSSSQLEEQISDHVEVECRSYESEDSFARNSESCLSKDLGSASHPGEVQSMNTSFSENGSHHSFDSADGSVGKEIFFPGNDLNGEKFSPVRKQGSNSSVTSSHNNYSSENPFHSTHPLSNSRYLGSGNDSHLQESLKRSSQFTASSALANSSSSKTFLEAAEETIQELRAESKMWERNSRKLMLDMDILKKDFSNQSIKQADKDVELSAAYAECDGLKKEVEQLKLVLEETLLKRKDKEDSTYQSESGVHIRKEMELEIKFQHEYNAELAMQLKRSQESNIELVNVLQELEETIEKQKAELENLSAPKLPSADESSLNKNQALLDMEMEYRLKISAKEEEIVSLKTKFDKTLVHKKSDDLGFAYESDPDLIGEIESLKGKLQELERDCSELTAENLELLLKLKDSKKEPLTDYSARELPDLSFSFSVSEAREPKSEIFDSEEAMKETLINKDQLTVFDFPDLVEQLQMAFCHVKKPWYNISSLTEEEFGADIADVVDLSNTDEAASHGGEDSVLNSFIKLNKLLERRIIQCEEVLKHCEMEIKERNDELAEAQKNVEDCCSKEKNMCLSIQKLESSNNDLLANVLDIENQLKASLDEINKLEGNLMLKEDDLGSLKECTEKLEVRIADLENEKNLLEEKLEIVQKENNSYASTNQNLEKELSELEKLKQDMDLHLNGLEKSNSHLLETTTTLEAQLRDLTDERESNLLEIENSKSVSMSLRDEIKRSETENLDIKQKLQDMQNQMVEYQNESENLKLSNQILEASVESLTEECSTLQMENELMREGKSELLAHCTDLETELRESQETSSDYSKRVEALEQNISSVLEDFASKEKRLGSEIDILLQENRNQNEKLILAENLSNQLLAEKSSEVDNLQMEIEKLKYQISMVDDEEERSSSENEQELYSLRACKANLESTLNEVQSKVKLMENELDTLKTDSESKENALVVELSTSRKKHELLMADHEKIKKSLGSYRSSEEKLNIKLNDIELKLTLSEYERQKLSEETANLKVELQKLTHFEEEIVALRAELDATKSEKVKLEASLRSAAEDCEDLKIEKTLFVQKISCFQTAMSEFEECKSEKVALEENLRQLKSDLSTRETLLTEDGSLKCELSQMKREYIQLQSKMEKLEEDKDEWMKHAQAFEKQTKAQSKSRSLKGDKFEWHDESHFNEVDHAEKIRLLEKELAQALEANNKYQNQLQRLLSEGKNNGATETTGKERLERTRSSLEAELRDIRERYFQMSLKYAEVEAEREDLVMKLKASKSGNKWFS